MVLPPAILCFVGDVAFVVDEVVVVVIFFRCLSCSLLTAPCFLALIVGESKPLAGMLTRLGAGCLFMDSDIG